MIDDIQEIIEKQLPNQVGVVLKKRLEQADKDAKDVINLNEKIKALNDVVSELQKELREHESLSLRESAVTNREKAVTEVEINFKLKEVEYKLLEAEKRADSITNIAMGLVRNTEYRSSLFDNRSAPSHIDQYGNQQYSNTVVNATEHKTTE